MIACTPVTLTAGQICFPSEIANGSFEDWGPQYPTGWERYMTVNASPTDPLLGQHAVELSNGQPWDGYLYQDFPCPAYPLFFGCAHWSWNGWGDEIAVIYFDGAMQEISRQIWESGTGGWQLIKTVLRPPDGTATIRVALVPMLDGLGVLVVDHVFMIPYGLP